MKKFVEEFVIKDHDLALDIVHALETSPRSGFGYEVEVRERVNRNDMVRVDMLPELETVITVRRNEFL